MDQDRTCPFPNLAKLALNVFSIPASSAECQRVFSQAKRTITDDQNQIGDETTQTILCQKDWLKKPLVQSDLLDAAETIKKQ